MDVKRIKKARELIYDLARHCISPDGNGYVSKLEYVHRYNDAILVYWFLTGDTCFDPLEGKIYNL